MDKLACFNSYQECGQQLADIQPIDFYFAQNAIKQLTKAADLTGYSELDLKHLFILLLACHYSLRNGHVCLPLEEVAGQIWFADDEHQGFVFEPNICAKLYEIFDKKHNISQSQACLFWGDFQSLYIKRYWYYEVEVAERLSKLMAPQSGNQSSQIPTNQLADIAELIQQLFVSAKHNEGEIDWQQVAVASSVTGRLNIICGGPGTGKTYTVARLLAVQALKHKLAQSNAQPLKIMMAAPTGKAAQRLTESLVAAKTQMLQQGIDENILQSIPESAVTLHRLLGYHPYKLGFTYNQNKPLNCDLLLIDEVSMIDLAMMCHILRALPAHCTLVMLGDADQLPSVETGNLLADIAPKHATGYPPQAADLIYQLSKQQVEVDETSQYAHLTFLQKTHRFSGEIGAIAKEVINAQGKQSWSRLQDNKHNQFVDHQAQELALVEFNYYQTWLNQAVAHYYAVLNKADDVQHAFELLAEFRILTAMRKGQFGVESINQYIEDKIKQQQRVASNVSHYKGRPIMVTQNDYQHKLFNGDIGLVWPDKSGRLVCYFESDNGVRPISLAKLPQHDAVYAMTIHKTQGSEFKHVGLILPESQNQLLTPELIYTGITRAKKAVTIVAKGDIWQFALKNRQTRYSKLANRLYKHA